MPLKPCKECGKEISTDAKSCPHCGKRSPTRSSTSPVLAVLGVVVVLGVFASLMSSPSKPVGSTPTPAVVAPPDTAAMRVQREKKTADSAAAVARIRTLQAKFRFSPDSIEGGGWYRPKSESADNSWNRTFLGIWVAANGRTYLESHFYGDSWIFHDHIVVRLGDQVLRSEVIPSYSDLNSRHNSSGSVWETLSFTGGKDNGILNAIAEAPDSMPIRVRLEGDDRMREFVLAKRDRIAIQEGDELGALLRKVCPDAGRGGALVRCP